MTVGVNNDHRSMNFFPSSHILFFFVSTIQTSPCLTFASPSLSSEHPRGEVFEIMNLELWTLTICSRLEDAEKLELGKLFLEKNRRFGI